MNKTIIVGVTIVLLTFCVGVSSACEVTLSCKSVQAIHVGKGRRHLADGKVDVLYGATVLVDTTTSNLKEVYANCPKDTIKIRVGDSVFAIPKTSTTPAGDWFGVDRPTPREALDAAMGMCPDKVIVHLPKSSFSKEPKQP